MKRILLLCAYASVLLGTLAVFGCVPSNEPSVPDGRQPEWSQAETTDSSTENVERETPIGSESETESSEVAQQGEAMAAIEIQVEANGQTLAATLENNSSAEAFASLLATGPLTVSMRDYADMEKVGSLPTALPRSDAQISVGPGDVVLYQGNQITVYYGTNSWNFTKLAHIEGATAEQMRAILGDGDADVTFSLA